MTAAPARRRSLWGWGFADRFPDEAQRQGLSQLVRLLLPHSQPALRPLPVEDEAALAHSVPRTAVVAPAALAHLCSASPLDRASHRRGKAYPDLIAGFAGDYHGAPDLIARPRTAEDVAMILAECAAHRLAVIPFGGGTSVVGGVDSDLGGQRDRFAGVVSLDLERLTGLLELDEHSRVARLGAGTTGPALEAALAPHGYSLRCYPQSFELSTLGGWLATRAGGHYATGPTHIDDLCQAMTMVTPRGSLATHRHPASGAGPEPLRLMLGSEGALGIITEAWMRVVPRPVHRSSASVRFAAFDDAVAAARALLHLPRALAPRPRARAMAPRQGRRLRRPGRPRRHHHPSPRRRPHPPARLPPRDPRSLPHRPGRHQGRLGSRPRPQPRRARPVAGFKGQASVAGRRPGSAVDGSGRARVAATWPPRMAKCTARRRSTTPWRTMSRVMAPPVPTIG